MDWKKLVNPNYDYKVIEETDYSFQWKVKAFSIEEYAEYKDWIKYIREDQNLGAVKEDTIEEAINRYIANCFDDYCFDRIIDVKKAINEIDKYEEDFLSSGNLWDDTPEFRIKIQEEPSDKVEFTKYMVTINLVHNPRCYVISEYPSKEIYVPKNYDEDEKINLIKKTMNEIDRDIYQYTN